MDSSNNNFKSFDDGQTELPEGFGWEGMKEGVYAKMPEQQPRRRIAAWWWFGAVGILALSFATYVFFSGDVGTSQLSDVTAPSSTTLQPSIKTTPTQEATTAHTDVETPSQQASNLSSTVGSSDVKKHILSKEQRTHQQGTQRATSLSEPADQPRNAYNPQLEAQSRVAGLASKPYLSSRTNTSTPKKEAIAEMDESKSSAKVQASSDTRERAKLIALQTLSIPFFLTPADVELPPSTGVSPPPTDPINAKPSYLTSEAIVAVPTSAGSQVNAPYLTPWYGLGASVGFQKAISERWSLSAQYTYQELKQEFYFTDRDTVTGSNNVNHTVEYRNSTNLALLSSSSASTPARFDRQREELSYNAFRFHRMSAFVNYLIPVNMRSSIEVGLGGGAQLLASTRGNRLDQNLEVVRLEQTLDNSSQVLGTVDARVKYLYQLSPKLQLSTGVGYSQLLSAEIPNALNASLGLRLKL